GEQPQLAGVSGACQGCSRQVWVRQGTAEHRSTGGSAQALGVPVALPLWWFRFPKPYSLTRLPVDDAFLAALALRTAVDLQLCPPQPAGQTLRVAIRGG